MFYSVPKILMGESYGDGYGGGGGNPPTTPPPNNPPSSEGGNPPTLPNPNTFTINISSDGFGTVTPYGTVSVSKPFAGGREYKTQQLIFTPDSGHKVDKVLINGHSIGSVLSYIIDPVDKDFNVDVLFTSINTQPGGDKPQVDPRKPGVKYYSLSVLDDSNMDMLKSLGNNGKIEYDNSQVIFFKNEYFIPEDVQFDFKIIPNKYFIIDNVEVNDVSVGSSGKYRIQSINSDVKIDANFKQQPIPQYDTQLLPTDFLFLKYIDNTIIPLDVDKDNSYPSNLYFGNVKSRIYNLFINSSIESKSIDIVLNNTNLYKLANPTLNGGSYYSNNFHPADIGASQLIDNVTTLNLKPFISSSLFVIKSRDGIYENESVDIYPYDIELEKELSDVNKNKPQLVQEKFEFQNNKHYKVEFVNYVYYYNDTDRYTKKLDTYKSTVNVSFRSNGMSDFKEFIPNTTEIDIKKPNFPPPNNPPSSEGGNPPNITPTDTKLDIFVPPADEIIVPIINAPNLRYQNKYFMRQICGNCIFNKNGFCEKYDIQVESDEVCDSWQVSGVSKEYKYSNGEYLLNGELYFGNYHLWAPSNEESFVAYTGNYFGELKERIKLVLNDSVKVLQPNVDSKSQSKSMSSVSSFKSLSTITSESLVNNIVEKISSNNSIKINVDYGNFKNFILFSSAYDRVLNFRTKLDFIEDYSSKISDIESLGSITHAQLSQSLVNLKLKKKELINNFTDFEKYLYFESGSIYSGSFVLPHPKSTSTIPYGMESVSSTTSVTYFNTLLQSASKYDEENFNSLYNKMPQYFREEGVTQFAGYGRLIKMYGEYFDFLWLHAKDISNKKIEDIGNKTNISPDLISYVLDYYNLFEDSKKIEGSLIDYYLDTDSYLGLNFEEYKNELYYRLMMNAPYIMKSRGTKKSIKAILNSMGIPENYLQIKEYGRNQENYDDDVDEIRIKKDTVKRFYLDFNGSENVKVNWKRYSGDSVPNAIQLKFKTDHNTGLYTSQVLLEGTSSISGSWGISLISTGSTYDEVSGIVKFVLSGSVSCSTSELPIFNGYPWTLYFYRDTDLYASPTQSYVLNIQQYRFDTVNFSSTSTLVVSQSLLNNRYNATGSLYLGGTSTSAISPSIYGSPFYGEASEFRLWKSKILDESNDSFVKASSFYGGKTSVTSSFTDLVTWLKLDEDINHYSTSSVNDYNLTGTKNHGTASGFEDAIDDSNYLDYYEEDHFELVNIDTNTPSDEKIYIVSSSLSSNALSPTERIEKSAKKLYGVESNKLSIDMSTNSMLNDDVCKSYDFEIDNFIGDPRTKTKHGYDNLDSFKSDYLKKYPSSSVDPYLIFDQAKGYDSLVFDIVKKNIPFKSDLQIGFRVEQTVLERFKNKDKLSASSTYNKYEDTISIKDEVITTAKYNDKLAIISSTSDIDISNSVENLSKTDIIKTSIKDSSDRLRYKTDVYDTPLSRVPGFSNYNQTTIYPTSEFSQVYTKSGNIFNQAFDSALEPTWATVNGVLNVSYSNNHIRNTRNDRFLRIIKRGTTQIQTCELDGKSIVEITKTTSKTARVFDDNEGKSILRVD